MSRQKEPDKLLEQLLQNGLTWLLSFILTSGLIGGSTFLFLSVQNEKRQLSDIRLEFQKQGGRFKSFTDMGQIFNTGWYSSTLNSEQILAILDELKMHKQDSMLDPTFATDSWAFCQKALIELNTEKGEISGFVIEDELMKSYQDSLVAVYSAQIQIMIELRDMINGWENETLEKRESRMKVIEETLLASTYAFSQAKSQSKQILSQIEIQENEMASRFEEGGEIFSIWQNKYYLSVAGFILGSVAFVSIVYLAYRRFSSKAHHSQPSNSNKVKLRKGKK